MQKIEATQNKNQNKYFFVLKMANPCPNKKSFLPWANSGFLTRVFSWSSSSPLLLSSLRQRRRQSKRRRSRRAHSSATKSVKANVVRKKYQKILLQTECNLKPKHEAKRFFSRPFDPLQCPPRSIVVYIYCPPFAKNRLLSAENRGPIYHPSPSLFLPRTNRIGKPHTTMTPRVSTSATRRE